jgi:hypothetical protein
MMCCTQKKKYDERASLEEEKKGERAHRLPHIVEPSRAIEFLRAPRNSSGPSCRIFIAPSRVEKILIIDRSPVWYRLTKAVFIALRELRNSRYSKKFSDH